MATPSIHDAALAVLRGLGIAEDALLGRAIVCANNGVAGTVCEIHLDKEHGLRVSIAGHEGKWPVSTIRNIGP